MIITIDGPAGTGKSTVAKRVAEKLNIPYFDTGAMYRAVSWKILSEGIDLADVQSIENLLKDFSFSIRNVGKDKRYFANDVDVTDEIRTQKVTSIVSEVSALEVVRKVIWKVQRSFGAVGDAVFEGRDMGTVVFPDADIKIFLTGRPEVRAERRLLEMMKKNPKDASSFNHDQMLKEIMRRDDYDSTRSLAPLKKPDDAYEIDTSDLTIDQVVDEVLKYQKKKAKKRYPAWLYDHKMNFLYRTILFLAWCYFKIFYRHSVYGLEHYYPKGAIIAANHVSFYDPPIVAISWMEEVHFLARETLFKFPLFGRLIRALNAHPVSGDATNLTVFKMVCALLNQGKKVILFPEGKRAETDKLDPLKPGIAMLISRTNTAVIPTYIYGTYKVWNRHKGFPKPWGKTACVFGSAILWESFAHLDKREAQEAFMNKLAESIESLRAWYENGAQGTPP